MDAWLQRLAAKKFLELVRSMLTLYFIQKSEFLWPQMAGLWPEMTLACSAVCTLPCLMCITEAVVQQICLFVSLNFVNLNYLLCQAPHLG